MGLFSSGFLKHMPMREVFAGDLTGKPRGAGPAAKACNRCWRAGFARGVAMRAPAVAIFGARQFRVCRAIAGGWKIPGSNQPACHPALR